MKKIKINWVMVCLALMLSLAGLLSGCNKELVDLTYAFDYGIVALPNGEIVEGTVQSWKDYEDGDQIQVQINGKRYLVHSSNIALIQE